MSAVQQIEDAVRQLSATDQAEFRAWFAEFDAAQWDRQIEADVASGRLDWLADGSRNQRSTKLPTDENRRTVSR